MMMISPEAPKERRRAVIVPIEGDRWYVSLGGWHKNHPPTDNADVMIHRLPSNQRRITSNLTASPKASSSSAMASAVSIRFTDKE